MFYDPNEGALSDFYIIETLLIVFIVLAWKLFGWVSFTAAQWRGKREAAKVRDDRLGGELVERAEHSQRDEP